MLKPEEASVLRKRLEDRTQELRLDILGELQKYDEERYDLLADRVADMGDQSFIHLLSDISLAEVSRDIDELREIEAALVRLADGSHGICIDCEEEINVDRLHANPSAARCLKCQTAFEHQDRETHIRTL